MQFETVGLVYPSVSEEYSFKHEWGIAQNDSAVNGVTDETLRQPLVEMVMSDQLVSVLSSLSA